MSKYQKAKNNARNKAIMWQIECCHRDYSYGELMEFQNYFEALGKRYGLLTEFRENGIC